MLVELAAAFHARVAGGDSLVVAAQAEGVDVEAVIEETERSRAHAEVFVVSTTYSSKPSSCVRPNVQDVRWL